MANRRQGHRQHSIITESRSRWYNYTPRLYPLAVQHAYRPMTPQSLSSCLDREAGRKREKQDGAEHARDPTRRLPYTKQPTIPNSRTKNNKCHRKNPRQSTRCASSRALGYHPIFPSSHRNASQKSRHITRKKIKSSQQAQSCRGGLRLLRGCLLRCGLLGSSLLSSRLWCSGLGDASGLGLGKDSRLVDDSLEEC